MNNFLLGFVPKGKGTVLLELESATNCFEERAIEQTNWKALMKFERVSLICEQSIYLVSSKEFFYKNDSAKKMMTKNLADS